MTHLKPLTEIELSDLIAQHNKGGAFARQITAAQTCWDSGIEIIKGCGHMKQPKYHVKFEPLADEKIKKLQKYFPSLEWLAYLVGKVDHKSQQVLVEDLVIPDSQQVTSGNVYDVEYGWNEGKAIIGVIHSHHGMGAFFSGTDDAYINQNHDVSIVVSTSKTAPIKGQVRIKTPCDSYVLAEDLTFSVEHPTVLDETEFEKEFTSKINSYAYRPPIGNGLVRRVIKTGANLLNGVTALPLLPIDGYYDKAEEEKLRLGLKKYYTEEEVDELIANGEAEEELRMVMGLVDAGVDLAMVDDLTQYQMSDSEWEGDGQTGFHQLPNSLLEVSMDDDTIWDLTEDDVNQLNEEPIKEVLQ